MKFRNFFISNSSSSSFVIAVKKEQPEPCPVCGCCNQNILDMFNCSNYYDTEILRRGNEVINNIKKNKKYCEQENYIDELKYLNSVLKKANKYMDNDKYELAEISISYHDPIMNKVLDYHVKNKNVIVLDKCD